MNTKLQTVSTASAMLQTMQKPTQQAKQQASEVKTVQYFRPAEYPKSGKLLFAYTCALLVRIGALEGKPFIISAFKGFYNTNTAFDYHVKQGNIETLGNGMAKLTVKGINKFKLGRVEGMDANQAIEEKVYTALYYLIGNGEWVLGKVIDGFSKDIIKFSIMSK